MTALGPTPGQRDLAAFGAKLRRLADSPRARRLTALEAWWKGLQYEGRASFWDPEVPLRERAPVVHSQIVRTSCARYVSFAFGPDRFPAAEVRPRAFGLALDDAPRAALSELLTEVIDALGLRTLAPQAMEHALATGSIALVYGLRDGLPVCTLVPARDCTPTLDARGACLALEIKYRFVRTGEDGRAHAYWYRRVVDAQADRVWPVTACDDEGYEPDWDAIAPAWTHARSHCQVVWHRSLPDLTDPGPDGTGLFEGLEDEVEALDFALSQRHRSARYNGEPQTIVVGVDPEQPIGAAGRTAAAPANDGRLRWLGLGSAVEVARGWISGGGGAATQKAPGKLWRLPPGGDAKLLESSGAGAAILSGDADDLTRRLRAAVGLVDADPTTIGANASAALMKQVFAPMCAVADRLREEWTTTLRRLLDGALRMLTEADARARGVRLAGWAPALPALGTFARTGPDGAVDWLGIPIELRWGAYFTPTWGEVQAAVTAVQAGVGGAPVISPLRAVKMLADVTGVEDAETELAAIRAAPAPAPIAAPTPGAPPPATAPPETPPDART